MSDSFLDRLAEQLAEHEDVRLQVYDDATGRPIEPGDTIQGHPTIGVGRKLNDDRGVSHEEAMMLLKNDLVWVAEKAQTYGFWNKLDPARQMVVMNMIFNMGNRFDAFKRCTPLWILATTPRRRFRCLIPDGQRKLRAGPICWPTRCVKGW